MTDDAIGRAPVYIDDDGAVVYRASSLGRCTGALVRARLGVTPSPPPESMQERFDEGHAWEERVLLAGFGVDWVPLDARGLKQYGRVIEDENATGGVQVETEIRWGKPEADGGRGVKVIRCHPDAIVKHGSRMMEGKDGNAERRVVEGKFLGKDGFWDTVRAMTDAREEHGVEYESRGLGFGYSMQLAVEMHSTGLPALYVLAMKDRDPSTGEVTLGEVYEFEVDVPPWSLAEVKAKVLEVEGWVARGKMPDCPVPLDYPCPYWQEHEHWGERVEVNDDAMLVQLTTQYQVAKEEQEALGGLVDDLRKMILQRCKEMNRGGSLRCNGWDVDVVAARDGNVSWKKAYDGLVVMAKKAGVEVPGTDEYRGEDVAESVKIARVK